MEEYNRKIRKLVNDFKSLILKKGVLFAVYRAIQVLIVEMKDFLTLLFYKYIKSNGKFFFFGEYYDYFYHSYNRTWTNERTVEVPIIRNFMKGTPDSRILEVGNVLSYYFDCVHDILDKYERKQDVINEDVVDFKPSKKYDLIVSISTLEHVGWDEESDNPKKPLLALENLLDNCLSEGGKIVFTFPLAYNPKLDELWKKNELPVKDKYYLKRISKDNKWVEAVWSEVKHKKYGSPFLYANAIVIGVVEKDSE